MQALIRIPEGLEMASVPDPRRRAPDDVLMAVTLVSLNGGEVQLPWKPGQIAGWDAYGVVLETSDDGEGPPRGARVTSWGYAGAWAQCRVVSRHDLAVVPEGVDPLVAAAIPAAGVSALNAVRAAGVGAGSRVAIAGGAGGVGHLAAQIAAEAGAEVTAVTRNPLRAVAAHSEVARESISFESLDDIDESCRFDAVIDTVGGPVLARLIEHLARRAKVVLVGSAEGGNATLDTSRLISNKASLVSLDIPTPLGDDIEVLLQLVASRRLRTVGLSD